MSRHWTISSISTELCIFKLIKINILIVKNKKKGNSITFHVALYLNTYMIFFPELAG